MNSYISYFRKQKYNMEIIRINRSNVFYPNHNHISNYIVGFILEGMLTLEKQNQKYILNSNSSFVIPPYEVHSMYSKKNIDMLVFSIKNCFIEKYSLDETILLMKKSLKIFLKKENLNKKNIYNLVDSIEKIYEKKVLREKKIPNYIDFLKLYLERYPYKKYNLEDLSKKAYISKFHLIRRFKKYIGLNPKEFQMQNRIRKSQHLMDIDTSLTEIALNMGFYDQSHFIKNFKNILMLTPSEYKKSLT